ncbi:MAG TPA: protein kinase [Gaiellaceae bacterium]
MSTTPSTQVLPERYRDAERIAHGAMGDVYRATDATLGRVVAVKLLAEPFVADDTARGRFAREARAAARVSGDPSIVTIYDVGETGERPYLVMEYVDGSSLEQRLRDEGAQAPADALRWLEQAGRGLDHAHANGVVHRDVKPGNLLVDQDDDLRVADFGIASAAWLPSLTVEGTVLGTAGYFAPEQALGERTSPASDRYALGVVAYELLTGARPFARDSPTAEMAAHVSAPVPPVSRQSGIQPKVDVVFERALAKRPEDRYATCAEFVAALRAALDAGAGDTRVLAPPPTAQARAGHRQSRWPLLAAGVGALVVVAVLLGVALSAGDGKPKPERRAQAPSNLPAAVHRTPPPVDPHVLNDRAWTLMQQGSYSAALPLLRRAVRGLRGTGPADPVEGYANYNLGFTLLQLGTCTDARTYLDHARRLEPDRHEVDRALDDVNRCLAPAHPAKQHGKGKGKGKHKDEQD